MLVPPKEDISGGASEKRGQSGRCCGALQPDPVGMEERSPITGGEADSSNALGTGSDRCVLRQETSTGDKTRSPPCCR